MYSRGKTDLLPLNRVCKLLLGLQGKIFLASLGKPRCSLQPRFRSRKSVFQMSSNIPRPSNDPKIIFKPTPLFYIQNPDITNEKTMVYVLSIHFYAFVVYNCMRCIQEVLMPRQFALWNMARRILEHMQAFLQGLT